MIADIVSAVRRLGDDVKYISVQIVPTGQVVVYVMTDTEEATRRLAVALGAPAPVCMMYNGTMWWNSHLGDYGTELTITINGGHKKF